MPLASILCLQEDSASLTFLSFLWAWEGERFYDATPRIPSVRKSELVEGSFD